MEVQITNKHENPLLGRTEVAARVSFEGATPSRADVLAEVVKAAKVKQEHTVIVSINTHFGGIVADVIANVYGEEKDKNMVEQPALVHRGAPKEEKKA